MYDDGRFAHHPYFKFIVHNMILRKRALENGNFNVQQTLGDAHLTVSDLKEKLQNGDDSIVKKICILVVNSETGLLLRVGHGNISVPFFVDRNIVVISNNIFHNTLYSFLYIYVGIW
jgi:hypothetical protein